MSVLFFLFRIYPCWSIPCSVIFFDLGQQLGKAQRLYPAWVFRIISLLLGLSSLAWIFARGDVHSDVWLRNLILS